MKNYRYYIKDQDVIERKFLLKEVPTDELFLELFTTEDCSFVTFRNSALSGVSIINRFRLNRSNIMNCTFKSCNIYAAHISQCTFENVAFIKTRFNHVVFNHCIFKNCMFDSCNWTKGEPSIMTDCHFDNCRFINAHRDLLATRFIGDHCAFSQCNGIFNPSDYLNKYFERNESDTGYIVYKTFGSMYQPCKEWDISPGTILYENCNMDRRADCSYGINVAPIEWVKRSALINLEGEVKDIWRCEILDKWLADVCVPYNTDGKIRCSKLRLIEIAVPAEKKGANNE